MIVPLPGGRFQPQLPEDIILKIEKFANAFNKTFSENKGYYIKSIARNFKNNINAIKGDINIIKKHKTINELVSKGINSLDISSGDTIEFLSKFCINYIEQSQPELIGTLKEHYTKKRLQLIRGTEAFVKRVANTTVGNEAIDLTADILDRAADDVIGRAPRIRFGTEILKKQFVGKFVYFAHTYLGHSIPNLVMDTLVNGFVAGLIGTKLYFFYFGKKLPNQITSPENDLGNFSYITNTLTLMVVRDVVKNALSYFETVSAYNYFDKQVFSGELKQRLNKAVVKYKGRDSQEYLVRTMAEYGLELNNRLPDGSKFKCISSTLNKILPKLVSIESEDFREIKEDYIAAQNKQQYLETKINDLDRNPELLLSTTEVNIACNTLKDMILYSYVMDIVNEKYNVNLQDLEGYGQALQRQQEDGIELHSFLRKKVIDDVAQVVVNDHVLSDINIWSSEYSDLHNAIYGMVEEKYIQKLIELSLRDYIITDVRLNQYKEQIHHPKLYLKGEIIQLLITTTGSTRKIISDLLFSYENKKYDIYSAIKDKYEEKIAYEFFETNNIMLNDYKASIRNGSNKKYVNRVVTNKLADLNHDLIDSHSEAVKAISDIFEKQCIRAIIRQIIYDNEEIRIRVLQNNPLVSIGDLSLQVIEKLVEFVRLPTKRVAQNIFLDEIGYCIEEFRKENLNRVRLPVWIKNNELEEFNDDKNKAYIPD